MEYFLIFQGFARKAVVRALQCVLFLTMYLIFGGLPSASAEPAVLSISSSEPVCVDIPDSWRGMAMPFSPVVAPYGGVKIRPKGVRNAAMALFIMAKSRSAYKDPKYLQNILRNDYQKHFQLPMRLAESEIEPFALPKGLACLAHNIDPKLVGKEVIKDDFKRTTLVIVGLQETYLIKAALYYDFPDEPDYEEMLRIVRSCRIQF